MSDIEHLNVIDITKDMADEFKREYENMQENTEILSEAASLSSGFFINEMDNQIIKEFDKKKSNTSYGMFFDKEDDEPLINTNALSITEVIDNYIKNNNLSIDDIKNEVYDWCVNNNIFDTDQSKQNNE